MRRLDPVNVEAEGTVSPPTDAWHVIDVHQSAPAHNVVRLDGQVRREAQLPGMFTIVPAGLAGTWEMSAKVHALLLRLSPSLFVEAGADLTPSINLRDPRVEQIAALIRAERDDGYPTGQLYLDSLAIALVARLVALQTARTPAVRGLPTRRLRTVVEYIHAHLDRDLHLDELAAIAGFSPSHFKLLFKQATGTPVHRYVLERRLARAHELLRAGDLDITQVALATGFSHGSHLARCMRRLLGHSPRDVIHRR